MAALYNPPPFYMPIIVPKTPEIEPGPRRPPRPSAPIVMVEPKYLLALAALLLILPEKSVPRIFSGRRRRAPVGSLEGFPYDPTLGSEASMADLSGGTMSCGVWQPVFSEKFGSEVWRCLAYGATCGANGECVVSGNKLKECVKTKKVFSKFYEKEIERCAEYKPICDPRGCLPGAMPKPDIHLQKNIDAQVKDVAKDMAEDANARTPDLSREIMSRGGIRSHAKGAEKEEYKLIPLHLKRKSGQPLDEIADEMGMREDELYQLIREAYPGGKKKKKRRFTWQDFEHQARGVVMQTQESSRELGDDLFPGLPREGMVLEVDDPATSDDPLIICMERRGWKPERIRDMQASISEKLTIDMFTGKPDKLTGKEKQLQEEIQECLDRLTRPLGNLGAAQYKAPAPGPHMEDRPFTKAEEDQFNRYTHFPIKFNDEFSEQVEAMEAAANHALVDHSVEDVPDRLDSALQWYRKQLYDYYLMRFKLQSYAPPMSVVGPAKYPTGRRAKADERERKSREKVVKAETYVNRAIKDATKGKYSQQQSGDLVDIAIHMKKIQFGKWYLLNETKKLVGDKSNYASSIRTGVFDASIRKKGRQLHEKIVRHAVSEGKSVIPQVIAQYPDLLERPKPTTRPEKRPARRASAQPPLPIFPDPYQPELFGVAAKWIPKDLKRGAFTAQAKRAGMATQEFARYVLENPEHFQRRTVSRARLARTFSRMARGDYSQNGLEGVGLNTLNALVNAARFLTRL